MTIPLLTWYLLRDLIDDGDAVRARFVPDHFNAEIVAPVLVLTVHHPDDPRGAKEKLNRFREECLIEVCISGQEAELWAEYDDAASFISGRSVMSKREDYSSADLLHVIADLATHLNSTQAQVVALLNKSHKVKSFIGELLHRATTKKNLTTKRTTAVDAQIQVLERVFEKFRDA